MLNQIEERRQAIARYEQEARDESIEAKKRNRVLSVSLASLRTRWEKKKDELMLCHSKKCKAEQELQKLTEIFNELSQQEKALWREIRGVTGM